jgi:putative membrane protein
MKYSVVLIAIVFMLVSCEGKKDSVEQAREQNQNAAIDEKISEFLTGAADGRMMGLEVGKIAQEKATTAQLKQYGQWMITENSKLLKELRMLAASKNIILPSTLSKKNIRNLEDLREETGEDFNDKFMKMMRKDHKHDVNEFEDAEDFKDKDVRQFAVTYRPVMESYLSKLEQIEKNGGQPQASGESEEK